MKKKLPWYARRRYILPLVFIFPPVGLTLLWTQLKWSKQAKWIVTGVLGVLFLITLDSSLNIPTKQNQPTTTVAAQNYQQPNQPIAQATTIPEAPTDTPVLQGLGITRAYLMDRFQQAAVAGGLGTIDFSQGTPANGQDNYTAQVEQNVLQLIGPADNLTEVSSTALIGTSSTVSDYLQALYLVLKLGNMIDPSSGDWVTSTIKAEADSGQDTDKESTVINGRKYELDMGTLGTVKSYALTVDPSQ